MGLDMETVLSVQAWCRRVPPAVQLGDVDGLEGSVYRGTGASPGSVWLAPDARRLRYRVYCEAGGQVHSDGLLHQHDLPADGDLTNPGAPPSRRRGQVGEPRRYARRLKDMRSVGLRVAAVSMMVVAACGSAPEPAARTSAGSRPDVAPGPATTAGVPSAARTPTSLGPEWRQQDGRVLIEAAASGDAGTLLRDLEALGLREGVVFGRLVNGWLPTESFAAAQRLASLQFVRPASAGTG